MNYIQEICLARASDELDMECMKQVIWGGWPSKLDCSWCHFLRWEIQARKPFRDKFMFFCFLIELHGQKDFSGGSASKESASNAEDSALIPGWGRYSGGGQKTTPVFLLEESHGQRSLAGCSSQSRTGSDMTEATKQQQEQQQQHEQK